nr:glycosyltransferase family 2 protein [Flavisolibacter sp.]
MNYSLIICTYMRPQALLALLKSVEQQSLYPAEIVIVDGSINDETAIMLHQNRFNSLEYFLVSEKDRGLTRQRNVGISKVDKNAEFICFLDDDTILERDYFINLIGTYNLHPEAIAVGGFITNESQWEKVPENYIDKQDDFVFDGWKRKDSSRYILRKKLGLDSALAPGFSPEFGHGRSVGFLPPSGKIYSVEHFMGGASSYRKQVFDQFHFSEYFEGYGLYEDSDFAFRLSK